MDADETARIAHRRGDGLDLERRRVGRQHRAGLDLAFQVLEQVLLDVEPLDDGLDDHVGAWNADAGGIGDETALGGVAQGLGLELAREQLALSLDAALDLLGGNVLQRHLHAGGDAGAGDISAHGARTDDVNPQRLPVGVLRRLRL